MSLDFFIGLGYESCGYWQRLSENSGAAGKELWYEFVVTQRELCVRSGPLVYIWVFKDEVIYVGETSRCVKARMNGGHKGGFRGGSKSGVEKQRKMLLLDDDRIEVLVAFEPYFLKYLHDHLNSNNVSNLRKIMLQIQTDMCYAKYREEKLIIAMLNPRLNKG